MAEQVLNLRPCPFCGGDALLDRHSYAGKEDSLSVYCSQCLVTREEFPNTEEAVSAWNNRFFSTEQIEMILSAEGPQHRQNKSCGSTPSLLLNGSFFYWLSALFFALYSFFEVTGEPFFTSARFSNAFYTFGLYSIGYALYRFARSAAAEELLESVLK